MSTAGPVIGCGEVLLRLKSPGATRLLQESRLEATFGGAEFNVLAQLARFGLPTELVTVLPQGPLGDAAMGEIQRQGVGTAAVHRAPGRMGLYFLDAGTDIRAGRVVYDRADSAFAHLDPHELDWRSILNGAGWLHLSGITAAVSHAAYVAALSAAQAASRARVPVSVDVNSRPSLWAATQRKAIDLLPPLLEQATLIFAGVADWQSCLTEPPPNSRDDVHAANFLEKMLHAYSNAQAIVSSLRTAHGADAFHVSAVAAVRGAGTFHSRTLVLRNVVDRVGAGDAMAAGCIYGVVSRWPWERLIDFAVAAGALKHTVPGDVGRASLEEIATVLSGADAGRLKR